MPMRRPIRKLNRGFPSQIRLSDRWGFIAAREGLDSRPMTPDRTKAARDLLAFYLEAGADALIADAPVDRFADQEPARPAAVAAKTAARAEAPRRASLLPSAAPPLPAPAAPLSPD